AHYETKYKPIYDKLSSQVNKLAEPLQLKPQKRAQTKRNDKNNPAEEDPVSKLKVMEYVKAFGWEALGRELSINVKRHREFPNLIHICADKLDSPQENEVVCECAHGIILEVIPNEDVQGSTSQGSAGDWNDLKKLPDPKNCAAKVVAFGYKKF